MPVSGSIAINTAYSNPSTSGTLGTDVETVNKTYSTAWAAGTAAGQIDRTFSESRTLVGTSTTYDLSALVTPHGTVAMLKVREVVISITASASPNGLTLGGEGSANEWTSPFAAAGDKLKLASLGRIALVAPDTAGYAVGTTNRLFKVDAGSATITFDIIIKGCSA